MERQQVKSTNIKSIGYDKENQVLEVEFINSSVYHYHKVSEKVYTSLINAKSHGIIFNGTIKGKYTFLKGEWEVPDFKRLKGIYPMPGIAVVTMIKIIPKNISSLITPSGEMAKSKTKEVEYENNKAFALVRAYNIICVIKK
jgi:hypothetical protein